MTPYVASVELELWGFDDSIGSPTIPAGDVFFVVGTHDNIGCQPFFSFNETRALFVVMHSSKLEMGVLSKGKDRFLELGIKEVRSDEDV